MLNFLRKLIKPKYPTLNKIEISAANILDNYRHLKTLQPTAAIFPVLKANAYGHGLKEMCQILNATDAPLVVVDSFPEAQIAYRYFQAKVLILGEMPLKAYRHCQFKRTEFTVYNAGTLKYLARFGKRAKVHLFFNSGMNREGLKDLPAFLAANKKYLAKVDVVGFCSHLASAEEDSPLNETQLDNFSEALETLRAAGFFPKWVHLGNSAALFKLDDQLLTAYRPGLALYGYNPFSDESGRGDGLKPALEVFSHIVSLQDLSAGESVSYNAIYHAPEATRIAVIPFGYFEGLDRRLSNRANFLVQTEREEFFSPIAGQVCMNLTCLDIGLRPAAVGDLVKIISAQPEDQNSLVNLSALMGTIPYEVLVKLQGNIRREII